MSAEKRPASDEPGAGQMIVKRQNVGSSTGALARLNASGKSSALIQTAPRTSNLQAPVMELSGHSGEIFAAKFDPTGNFIASGSMDRSILLWRTYGDCENYGVLTGHRGAVLDLQWSRDSKIVYSASADTHLASWDLENGTRIRRYIGHDEIVNTMDISKRGEGILVSGSDDGTIGLWDPRSKHAADHIETEFPITAIAMSEAGNEVYSGGIDNDIKVWDIRKKSVVYSMLGHQDTVTSLRASPDSQSLLSFAMDSTVRTWDIRPFAPTDRHIRTFDGASVGLEKNLIRASWDTEGKKVAVGSGDGTATIWSSETGKLMYKLPGHKGTVNCVEFAPGTEPIGTRLNSPHLTRTWTSGSNGPDLRPSSTQQHLNREVDEVSPESAILRAGGPPTAPVTIPAPVARVSRSETTGRTRRFTSPDPAEMHLAQMVQEGRRRRRRANRRQQQDNDEGHPKRFLLCIPWPKSRRMRSQILRCFILGFFLALLLVLYLALSLTKNIRSGEFTVLFILVILFVTVFFCHGLIRLCMLVIRPRPDDEPRPPIPQLLPPGSYAVPREPIRVMLARDEEEQGEVSEAVQAKPPAYGLWRESVRVDPNRIYWQRNPNAVSSNAGQSTLGESNGGARPPSYASEDGVSYVVNARPRSMAPIMMEAPMPPHPSEIGRMGERRNP
ncbi:U5 small nuclear ribonucleoprotein 40 kDa protein [Colletotrichum tanaceti]|uniref:U5 small nuclear ribonucleoprotein 40 kDa protein n=1 Tax=Colletotrichum tanaceti TaxID=1306861 RepID=A0A4U6XA84_9PEZI|nr:U5 small nuclear ribonucleoprotein 40 kDa protein [Colletotrichum tanaceti]TKW52405.1 U5 small nuclear ribonucleoprotein 40 kDa protein [Colletotrichum tanaceti]